MNEPILNVVIADPHEACRALLRARIGGRHSLRVIAEAGTAWDVARSVARDVVFAAVDPAQDVLEQLRELKSATRHVVVLADTPMFAADAFEAGATDYLLKPLDARRVDKTLDRLLSRASERARGDSAAKPSERLSAALASCPRLTVPTAQGFTFIDPNDIESVVAERNYTTLATREHSWRIRRSLSAMHEQLGERKFLRIHRCVLINAAKIRSAERDARGTLTFELESGRRFSSARNYSRQIRSWLRASA